MDGRKVFKLAAAHIKPFQAHLLQLAGCQIDDINWVVPHQGSHLGIAHIHKILGIATDKVINIYREHGNQVGASIPTALHEIVDDGRWQKGNKVMLMGTAASLSLAAVIWVA
jgi:3-oxoacyl-[acyl-carrier-protein] synthase-3